MSFAIWLWSAVKVRKKFYVTGQSSSRRARLWPFFLSGIAHGANGRNVRYFYCARNFLAMRNIHETRTTYANLIRRGDALGVPRPWPTRISIA